MESKWQIIKEWSKLTPRQQLSTFLIFTILSLGSVIIYEEHDKASIRREYDSTIARINDRSDRMVATERDRTEAVQKHLNDYVEKNEKDMRDILFSVDKIKTTQKQLKKNK